MATYKKKLLDSKGNVILPYTRSNLVYHGTDTVENQLNSVIATAAYAVEKAGRRLQLAGGTLTGRVYSSGNTAGLYIKNCGTWNSAGNAMQVAQDYRFLLQ